MGGTGKKPFRGSAINHHQDIPETMSDPFLTENSKAKREGRRTGPIAGDQLRA